jgi:hypothetical protein
VSVSVLVPALGLTLSLRRMVVGVLVIAIVFCRVENLMAVSLAVVWKLGLEVLVAIVVVYMVRSLEWSIVRGPVVVLVVEWEVVLAPGAVYYDRRKTLRDGALLFALCVQYRYAFTQYSLALNSTLQSVLAEN